MLILSVDPGALRGAYAVLDASGSLLEVADLPKVADHKTRWVDAPVLLSRPLEIKPVATLRRRIPSSIATTRHSGGAGRFRIRNKIASSSSGLNGPANTTSLAKILPMNERSARATNNWFGSRTSIPGRPTARLDRTTIQRPRRAVDIVERRRSPCFPRRPRTRRA